MTDEDRSLADVPAPMNVLFDLVSDAFDALEAATGEEIALDIFFEEVEFAGEEPRLCLTVNDLVSTYHDADGYTVVLTTDDEEHPWFRRDTPVAAAEQIVRLLVDAEFLTAEDAGIMIAALHDEPDEPSSS